MAGLGVDESADLLAATMADESKGKYIDFAAALQEHTLTARGQPERSGARRDLEISRRRAALPHGPFVDSRR